MDIPIAHWNELNTFDYDDYYHAMIAFIAVDEHGLGASSFHEFIAIDWSQFEEETRWPWSLLLCRRRRQWRTI